MFGEAFHFAFLRIILPITLFLASFFRYNGFSFVYLCFLLACPLLKRCKSASEELSVRCYLVLLVIFSAGFSISHGLFHGLLSGMDLLVLTEEYNCTSIPLWIQIFQQIGLQNMAHMKFHRVLRLLFPDPLVLVVSVVILSWHVHRSRKMYSKCNLSGTCQKGHNRQPSYSHQSHQEQHEQVWRAWFIDYCGVMLTVILTGIAGIMSPSILSLTYLFIFVIICTYWACRFKHISLHISYARLLLLIYSGLHLILYYLYQFPFFQLLIASDSPTAGLLGLYYIIRPSCSTPGEIDLAQRRWIDYIAPSVTLALCYVVGIETRRWCDKFNINNPIMVLRYVHNKLRRNETIVSNVSTPHSVTQGNMKDGNKNSEEKSHFKSENATGNHDTVKLCHKRMASEDHRVRLLEVHYLPAGHCPDSQLEIFDGHRSTSCHTRTPSAFSLGSHQRPSFAAGNVSTVATGPSESIIFLMNHHSRDNLASKGLESSLRNSFGNPTNESGCGAPVVTERPLVLSIIHTAIRNSYVLSLISMMAWSVAYRTWLSFVLLILACGLWVIPNNRRACLYFSPLIVFYGVVLLFIQYFSSLNQAPLPSHSQIGNMNYHEIGFQKYDIPTGPLAVQIGFLVTFWLTLRLFLLERNNKGGQMMTIELEAYTFVSSQEALEGGSTTQLVSEDNRIYCKLLEVMKAFCVRYWICVCCMAMLFVSIQEPVVIFRIVYMILLLYFIVTFKISYRFWRKQMPFFWWVVITYSMVVLCCIHTYQFQQVPYYWLNKTSLSNTTLQDIGLEQFHSAALLQRLLSPVIFIVVIILQVHYFHKPFLELSNMNRYRLPTSQANSIDQRQSRHRTDSDSINTTVSSTESDFIEDVNTVFHNLYRSTIIFFRNSYYTLWRLSEIHCPKLLWCLVMVHCVHEVSITNMVFLVLLTAFLPFMSLRSVLNFLILAWAGLLLVTKMVYQLRNLNVSWTTTCNGLNDTSMSHFGSIETWLGLNKSTTFLTDNMALVFIIVVATMCHGIDMHQRQFYNSPRHSRPLYGVIFPGITLSATGDTVLNFVKYLMNYAFYKMGLELCFCTTVISACLRVDAYSVLYLVILLFFLFSPRSLCARLWLSYCLFLGVLLPFQYFCCLGFPPFLCIDYFWQIQKYHAALQQWLFLPNYQTPPVSNKLYADFFQFVCVCLQYHVFCLEREHGLQYGGGSNQPVLSTKLPPGVVKDFISSKENYMDYVKHAVFYWSYWFSLVIVFITGVTWITLFCLGYIIISFIYLWMGQNIILRKRKELLSSWNFIIAYNFMVIFAKASFQLIGCVYWNDFVKMKLCWLIQVLGVQCLNPLSLNKFDNPKNFDCAPQFSGLHWDVICFIVIVLQRRLFMTHSFTFVFIDLAVQSKFASRGAYLINHKLREVIAKQHIQEEKKIKEVRCKIEAIRRRQQKLGKNIPDVKEHYLVLRSGDHYLFEGDPEEEDITWYNKDDKTQYKHSETLDDITTATIHDNPRSDVSTTGGTATVYPFPDYASSNADEEYNGEVGRLSEEVPPPVIRRRHTSSTTSTVTPMSNLARPPSFCNVKLANRISQDSTQSCIPTPTSIISTNPALNPFIMSHVPRSISMIASCNSGMHHSPTSSSNICQHASSGPAENNMPFSGYVGMSLEESLPSHILSFNQPISIDSCRAIPTSVKSQPTERLNQIGTVPISRTFDNQLEEEDQESDEENPAGERPAATLNPIKILNQVIQQGPRVAVRNYRRCMGTGHSSSLTSQFPQLPVTANQDCSSIMAFVNNRRNSVQPINHPSETMVESAVSSSRTLKNVTSDNETPMLVSTNNLSSPKVHTISSIPPFTNSPSHHSSGIKLPVVPSKKSSTVTLPWKLSQDEGDNDITSSDMTEGTYHTASGEPNGFTMPPSLSPKRSDRGGHFRHPPIDLTGPPPKPKEDIEERRLSSDTLHGLPLMIGSQYSGGGDLPLSNPFQISSQPNHSTATQVKSTGLLQTEEKGPEVALKDDPAISPQQGCWSKLKSSVLILALYFAGAIDASIRWMNSLTNEYRRIRRKIDREKRVRKRDIIVHIHSPPSLMHELHEDLILEGILDNGDNQLWDTERGNSIGPISFSCNNHQQTTTTSSPRHGPPSTLERMDTGDEMQREKEFKRSRNRYFLLIIAVGNLAIVYSELICYGLLVLNHLCSATVLSLPYPLMVALWAMLSVPRPSKNFWITLITYTEIVIVIKYIFQFPYFQFNQITEAVEGQPLFWPLIIGIHKEKNHYALFDMIQLLFIFLHRGYLKNNGLWRDHAESRLDLEKTALAIDLESKKGRASAELLQQAEQLSRPYRHFINPVMKLRRFYHKMTDPSLNKKVDVYVYMFITEFIAIVIIIFGYKSFGPSTAIGESAFEFLRRNRIPVPFICMLVVQFLIILLDRALFLRKHVLGKFVFQIIHVLLIHAWLFFILPWITKTSFTDSLPPKLLYLVKCLYFILSAYQIRSGYPKRIMGNFLTQNYNYINLVLFKCYLVIPFLYEMRNIMDWIWTDTTLALYHWMEVEDIFSKVFSLKCWRRAEHEYPTPRSCLRYAYIKYTVGFFFLGLCFFAIWTPLAVSSFIGTTFVVNPPVQCRFEVAFASYPSIFTFTARHRNLTNVKAEDIVKLKECYDSRNDQRSLGFLNHFHKVDISDIHIASESAAVWTITPPHLRDLKHHLNLSEPMHLHFDMTCRRTVKEFGSSEQVVVFSHHRSLDVTERHALLHTLNAPFPLLPTNDNTSSWSSSTSLNGIIIGKPITLRLLTPRFVVARRDRLEELPYVSQKWNYVNVRASLFVSKDSRTGEVWRWWKLEELYPSNVTNYQQLCPRETNVSSLSVLKEDYGFRILSFNERVYDNLFGKVFTSYGIIGLYAAYIFVVHRILRILYSDITYIIQYQEMPNVDRILKLCHDIYLVRENGMLDLEEELVARLIFLFRSNESLIKYTKHRKKMLEDFSKMPFPPYNKVTAKTYRE